MTDDRDAPNPDDVPGAPPARAERVRVNGTLLYAAVHGAGPAILIVPGGAEDAEGWRAIAERLPDHLVVTYDRRGTGRSGRDRWPGLGSAQHADDAAGLLDALGIETATAFGASTGGIIATELALRHPRRVSSALVFEPGYLTLDRAAAQLQRRVEDAVRIHLDAHEGDWPGAYDAFLAAVEGPATQTGFLDVPDASDWYRQRERLNAEAMVRDDIPILTHEAPDEQALRSTTTDVRFAFGSESVGAFRAICTRLAQVRATIPEEVEGVGHALYLFPERAAAYLEGRAH